MTKYTRVDFSILLGKTLTFIDGADKGSEEIVFTSSEGERYRLTHYQGCCENVEVEDVIGDVEDLLNSPLLLVEETTNRDDPGDYVVPEHRDSFTWTFYRLATAKGHVDIRWLGTSNGYYSEKVTFEKLS